VIVAVATQPKSVDKIELSMRILRDWIDNKRAGEIRLRFFDGKVQKIVEEIAH
jgi:hypothetical protein